MYKLINYNLHSAISMHFYFLADSIHSFKNHSNICNHIEPECKYQQNVEWDKWEWVG